MMRMTKVQDARAISQVKTNLRERWKMTKRGLRLFYKRSSLEIRKLL